MVGFAQFTRERQYLSNVSPATLEWYKRSFKWLRTESPSQDDLKDAVVRMREKGRKATGCNSAIRAINAYLKWSGSTLKISQLKEPQLVLPTFTAQQIRLLVTWKPKHFCQRRLHLLVLILLDTGCRITETLNLRVRDVDMENLLITLDGKGRKQRIVPFSFELRKVLFRYVSNCNRKPDLLLLANRNETLLGRRVVLRDVKLLCKRLGFDPSRAHVARLPAHFRGELSEARRVRVPSSEGARTFHAGDDAAIREPDDGGLAGCP